MNQEGMDDRYYFSDWGGCICTNSEIDPDCPMVESGEHEGEEDE